MQSYEKAPIIWPDTVTITTDAVVLTFQRVPGTSYYRYAGEEGAYPAPPRHFLAIDPPWLANGEQIVVVQPPESDLETNPALRNAFQFVVL